MTTPKQMKAPPLDRNTACRVCRSRKVRCDGVRPICGTCIRSAQVRGMRPQDMNCTWPEQPLIRSLGSQSDSQDNSGVQRDEEDDKILELEERISRLEAMAETNFNILDLLQTNPQNSTLQLPQQNQLSLNPGSSSSIRHWQLPDIGTFDQSHSTSIASTSSHREVLSDDLSVLLEAISYPSEQMQTVESGKDQDEDAGGDKITRDDTTFPRPE